MSSLSNLISTASTSTSSAFPSRTGPSVASSVDALNSLTVPAVGGLDVTLAGTSSLGVSSEVEILINLRDVTPEMIYSACTPTQWRLDFGDSFAAMMVKVRKDIAMGILVAYMKNAD